MKDRVFTGQDVEEALASAAASLGLPKRDLRYVVLDPGTAGGRGLKATPARIAVLLHDPAGLHGAAAVAGRSPGWRSPEEPRDEPREEARETAPAGEPAPERDAKAGVRAIVRAVAEAGGLEIDADIEESDEAFVVRLNGRDAAFFHGENASGDVLYALEHLLQRTFGETLRPRVVRLRCEGFREARDKALTEEALQLAAEVRETGRAVQMEPLNAYDRRIVHLALQDMADIRTYSVGEGLDRRVTVAPASKDDTPGTPGGEADGR